MSNSELFILFGIPLIAIGTLVVTMATGFALCYLYEKFKSSYYCYRLTEYGVFDTLFVDIIRPIQFFWQRLTRGFDDSCTWSLDCHLAKLILPRLKLFREAEPRVAPHSFFEHAVDQWSPTAEESAEGFRKWDEVLDKMIFSFEYLAGEEQWNYDLPLEEEQQRDKEVQEGLDLFARYYRGLWT